MAVCKYAQVVATFPGIDLAAPSRQHAEDLGYLVGDRTIRRHRAEQCVCYAVEVSVAGESETHDAAGDHYTRFSETPWGYEDYRAFIASKGQDPDKVQEAFRAYVRAKIPADCTVDFIAKEGSPALRLDFAMPALEKGKTALKAEWGKDAALTGMGGSIPIVGDFKRMLGMDSLMIGFGLEDDQIHSPNEKYNLTSFHKGIRSWARVLNEAHCIRYRLSDFSCSATSTSTS